MIHRNYIDWLPDEVVEYIYWLRWKSMMLNIHLRIKQQYFKIIDPTTSERIINHQNGVKTKLIQYGLHSVENGISLLKIVVWTPGKDTKRNTIIGADERSTCSYLLP